MKFGQYELLERVAVGGMAEVFRGRVVGAEGFEKWVAIKRILPEFAKDDRFISMMLTEARIHSALSHRNIVQIHDLGTSEDGEYFIVLEYVEGHDLRAVLEAATALGVQIPDNLALHIADELAQALHCAHELRDGDGQPLGIVHRDVSPSNVLISNSGEVKLSDFGIAKRRRDHSVVGSLKGNLVYMSPEQARRVPLDRRTDVFSLGAVLFEMLTGGKVREVSDEVNGFQEAASGVVRSATELRPDIPAAYASLLARALAANPAERFQDAAAFGAAIRELQRSGDRPVGPADVQELVEVLDPPRRARSPVELSRVIRLGPEFRVGGPAEKEIQIPSSPSTAPASAPAPAMSPLQTRIAPRARATTENGIGAARAIGSPSAPAVSNQLSTPSGAGRTATAPRRAPPRLPETRAPNPLAATPPPILPGDIGQPGPAALAPGALTPPPTPPPSQLAARSSEDALVSATPPPKGTPQPLGVSQFLALKPHSTPPPSDDEFNQTPPPRSGAHPLAGWSAPPAVLPLAAPTPKGLRSGDETRVGVGGLHGPVSYSGLVAPDIVVTSGPRRSRIVVGVAVVIAAAAAVVHITVIPLQVAAVWLRAAELEIRSEPSAATVSIDGRTLPGVTPLRVEVKRDRLDHKLTFSRAGSVSAQAMIRFDRTIPLQASVVLVPEPLPPAPPPEAKTAPPKSEPSPGLAATTSPTADNGVSASGARAVLDGPQNDRSASDGKRPGLRKTKHSHAGKQARKQAKKHKKSRRSTRPG